MRNTGSLQVTTPSDREIRIERSFSAPRRLVYDAYTKPELVKRWLGSMPGWSWAVCEMDVRVGGRYRWVWKGPDGAEMGMGGAYREIVPQERIVNTEKFDQAWYEGEAVDTVVFTEHAGKTTVTTSLLYISKEVRDVVLQSPATEGMEMGYQQLEAL
ncbi:MAG TPA: SRPBCC family protein, partial [Gemmatimonadaceae bacterium]|nr:SRPBCC family protein [Gemmatimonadaceae bacterium]